MLRVEDAVGTRFVSETSAVGISRSLCSPSSANRSAANFGSWPVPNRVVIVDEIRNVRFAIAVLTRVHVEHQLRRSHDADRASAPLSTTKRLPDKLRGRVEIDETELLAERDVVDGSERKRAADYPSGALEVGRRRRPSGTDRDAADSAVPPRNRFELDAELGQPRFARRERRRRASPTSRFSDSTSSPAAFARPMAFDRSLRSWRSVSTSPAGSCARTRAPE